MRRATFALFAVGALLAGWLAAQRAVGPMAGYDAEPGGTPEDQLWQVIVTFGVGEREPASWDGRLTVTGGSLLEMEGYRFELPDRILPQGGWQVRTKVERVTYGQGIAQKPMLLPKGLVVRGSGSAASKAIVETAHGNCEFAPMAMVHGAAQRCADGRMEVQRIPAATDLSGTELRQHDFPSIAAGPNQGLFVTWSSFHDLREELNFRAYNKGKWTRLIPVPRASEDLFRPQVTTDEKGVPWLIWSQQVDRNWEIYAMPWIDNDWGALEKLSANALPDIEPHVARAGDGTIYVVWQAMEGRVSHIHLRYRKNGKWSDLVRVSNGAANDWEPAVAVAPDNSAWIAWDRYNASYDVHFRRFSPATGLGEEWQAAASERMEAYASIAVDNKNRVWVAWESGGENWGKDLGPLSPRSPGSPLGDARRIGLAVFDASGWKTPAEPRFTDSLETGNNSVCRPVLHVTGDGSLWMTFKRRYSRIARNPSTHWESFLTALDGDRWTTPMLLPKSASRNSNRIGLASTNDRLWLFWPSESRRYDFSSRPRLHRVIAGSVPLRVLREPKLTAYAPGTAAAAASTEAADVRAIREHQVKVNKQALRIVRGDLHRHTEFSQDQGGLSDGSLPEFYRYMIDAAAMDFGASTDHQAGGFDYWAFFTLKMADMYHFPERFVPLYAYERNLGFPHGHRNIIHTKRDYPIVPFFQRMDPKFQLPDAPDGELLTFNSNSYGGGVENDTKLLYEELRKSGGLAIPHTSGSNGMGTDWRDNNRELEPLVEIYQGDRHSYESKNAPRGVKDGEEKKAIGGFQEAGMVWNAWKKGYRLGVIASSDHFSTHISYAMVYTPGQDRQSIFEAIKKRHAYGATDNIVLEFWLGDHFMGDDFVASKREKVRVKVKGTGPVKAVHLLRDAAYIHAVKPGTKDVAFDYLDATVTPGDHWYYVRVEQENGELAWSSPIWVRYGK